MIKSITMNRDYRITKQTIDSLRDPNIQLGHLWNDTFFVYLKDGEKYIAHSLEYQFHYALETIRNLILLGVPTKIDVHGSTTYTSHDILEFLSTPKYDPIEEER